VTLSPTLLLDIVIGGFMTGGIYALVALGLNLQYGLMRVLNVAHGEFLMLGAYTTFALHTGWGVNPLLTLLVTGPTAFAVGLVAAPAALRPAGGRRGGGEPRVALAPALVRAHVRAPERGAADLERGPQGLQLPRDPAAVARHRLPRQPGARGRDRLALGVAFYLYLRYSLTGKAVRALMREPEGAQLVGIQTSRIHGMLRRGSRHVGGDHSLVSMLFELTPFMGLPYTVTALVVVILGGLGNVVGSLLGALLLGVVETAGVYLASSDIRLISSYAVLSLILILKPSGIFGR
jgi:branched-chain amino acid transport system permease protein